MARQLLITAAELAEQLEDPALRILDVTVHLQRSERGYQIESGLEDYRAAHVPGAAFVDQAVALSNTDSGLGFTLPEPDVLAAAFAELGIGTDTAVVVYATGPVMWATRAFWLLDYLGHPNVRVLDGGLAAWQAAGLPTHQGDESYAARTFAHSLKPSRFVLLDEMQEIVSSQNQCVVNALPEPVYTGASGALYGRPGHIPGSVNLPYDNLLSDGRFLPREKLLEALQEQGLAGTDRVVVYCGGGISATIPGFSRLLCGLEETAIYDGSMSEWVRADLPLTEGSEP